MFKRFSNLTSKGKGAAFCLAMLGMVEFAGAVPTLPTINTANVFNVTNAPYNANGNGTATNTTAIQNAINAAAAASERYGRNSGTGRVFVRSAHDEERGQPAS